MTEEVELRVVVDGDLPVFFEHQADPVANQMAAFPARDRDRFMAHRSKICNNEQGILRTIVYRGQVAGYITSFDMEGHREVGYWIGREFWGKGIATRALAQFLAQENSRPLYGYVAKHNAGSRRVLEKCGFQMVGEERNDFVWRLK